MKKNDIINVKIIDMGNNGEGIAKFESYTIFIPYALLNEEIEVLILKVTKTVAYGKIKSFITKNPNRIEPLCPNFFKCGGCDMQHISYDNQIDIKTKAVQTTLKKAIKDTEFTVNKCIPSEDGYHYRNKMQFPINDDGIGMYRINSHTLIPLNDCCLANSDCKTILSIFKEYINQYNVSAYNEKTHTGLLRHLVYRTIDDKIMFTLVINGNKLPFENELTKELKLHFKNFSLFININKQKNNKILTENFIKLYGDDLLSTNDLGIQYYVSPLSFLQINRCIQNKIYSLVQSLIPKNSIVIDTFSGAGLMTAILSQKSKFAYGIEIIKSATLDANELIKRNNITNVKNINGDCNEELPKLISELKNKNEKNICIVVDPPRKGIDASVLNTIIATLPTDIVYVSCNVATLARDLQTLTKFYNIDLVQPFDMFPQTKHIETVVKLSLKK